MLAHQEVLLLDLALGLLDLLGEHAGLDRLLVALLVGGAQAVEDLVDPLAGEEPHEVVLGAEEEPRLARIPLAARATAQLVVDPSRFVALGSEDEEAAELEDLLPRLGHTLLDRGQDLLVMLVVVGHPGLESQLGEAVVDRVRAATRIGAAATGRCESGARRDLGDRATAEANGLLVRPARLGRVGAHRDVDDVSRPRATRRQATSHHGDAVGRVRRVGDRRAAEHDHTYDRADDQETPAVHPLAEMPHVYSFHWPADYRKGNASRIRQA